MLNFTVKIIFFNIRFHLAYKNKIKMNKAEKFTIGLSFLNDFKNERCGHKKQKNT